MAAKPRSKPVIIDENAVNIFTDGSMYSRPRRGGVGIVIVVVGDDGHDVVHTLDVPGYAQATNNAMELMAVILALKYVIGRHSPVNVRDYSKVIVHTDAQYVANNINNAKFAWPREGWMTRDGNPVANAEQWRDLVKVIQKVGRVEFRWHHGHKKDENPFNDVADRLAKASALGPLQGPLRPKRVRRKTSQKTTDRGSIPPEGQRITLRIITDEWLRVQRMYAYKCEVVDDASPYHGNVDDLFSERMLDAGHTYDVLLSDEPSNPWIVHVYDEVEDGAQ